MAMKRGTKVTRLPELESIPPPLIATIVRALKREASMTERTPDKWGFTAGELEAYTSAFRAAAGMVMRIWEDSRIPTKRKVTPEP